MNTFESDIVKSSKICEYYAVLKMVPPANLHHLEISFINYSKHCQLILHFLKNDFYTQKKYLYQSQEKQFSKNVRVYKNLVDVAQVNFRLHCLLLSISSTSIM